MIGTTEAFSRVKIDDLLADAGWNLTDGTSFLFEHALGDGSRADYVLCDRAGRPMAVLEAKRASADPIAAQDQGRHYAEQLEVPFVFLSNGDEVWFLDRDSDAHAREIATFSSQEDLERRIAARLIRRALADVPVDRRIVDRGYQVDCVETLSDEVTRGRRKLLVEMATGTAKTAPRLPSSSSSSSRARSPAFYFSWTGSPSPPRPRTPSPTTSATTPATFFAPGAASTARSASPSRPSRP